MLNESSYYSYVLNLLVLITAYVGIGIGVKAFFYIDLNVSAIWDIEHYLWIKENGYKGFRVVFFPLFPWLWRLTSLSLTGISVLNILLVLFSSSYFAYKAHIPKPTFLLLISIFSSLFYAVPYSESIFFTCLVFSALAIHLLNKKFTIGFLIAAIARPASTILVPATFLMICISWIRGNQSQVISLAKYVLITSGMGIILIMILNQINTGNPISFYLNQKLWASELAMPSLPLRSWGSGLAIRLDFLALSTILCFVFFYIREKAYKKSDLLLEFSIAYILWFFLVTLAFRGGSLHSFNRFIFCSPFFLYLGYKIFYSIKIDWKSILILYISLTCMSFLAESYVHIRTFLWFQIPILYLLVYIYLISKSAKFNPINILFLILNGFILNFLLMEFYSGNWIA
tara:strand:- start:51 stop:1250 length:1200 start_codon:yes stop_codon:yes gene_type:complete